MKTRFFSALVVVASLVLVLTWGASAQGPEPQFRPDHDAIPVPQPDSPDPSPQRVNAPAVALGQPGFNYRYLQTFGITEQAYLGDALHLNGPTGLFIDNANNLYVVENQGFRVLKYNASGSNLLILGTAGLCYTANYVFCVPQDVAVDNLGNIWVADGQRVAEYTVAGTFMQTIPATNSFVQGTDNYHFKNVHGVAFDSSGRMYVSDGSNHRIQIYSFSGSTPVYSSTIGVTGVSGSDNLHFNNPYRIVLDGSDQLYVADQNNNRVQRCTYSGSWTCTTLAGGLNNPRGIARDSSNNIYIADTNNARIRKCDSGGVCSDFITGLTSFPHDVAVDSGGNVYVSERFEDRVSKYNSSGVLQGVFVGTTFVPYVADTVRINAPWGIAVAVDGSLYVIENSGNRLLKLNAAGVQQWAVGQAGVPGSDNAHFNNPRDVALDSNGRIYVADCANNRIQIFMLDSSYVSTLGSFGSGNNQFNCPVGLFIAPDNTLYVADQNNHRVQIFDSNQLYVATIGVTGVSGSDNAHFNSPQDVAVDNNSTIYVSDANNQRIQAFNSSRVYQRTMGAGVGCTGRNLFDEFCNPRSLAVDAGNNLYMGDDTNRVQVFDPNGAYLTTLGGNWGSLSGQMRQPYGLAFDQTGNLYVTDLGSHRIQKFALGVPGWRQTNINGFGDRRNSWILALAPFGGQLYAGTFDSSFGTSAQLWRTGDGTTWAPVITNGFGLTRNVGIDHLSEFNGQLYAATSADIVNGGEIWRSSDGSAWNRVVASGFGDPINAEVRHFAVFNNMLYASTASYSTTIHGGEIWRSSTGNTGDWTRVVTNGFGNANTDTMLSFAPFNGYLYAATRNAVIGGAVWRTNDGVTWNQVSVNAFGAACCPPVSSLASFNGNLYASVFGSGGMGAHVWRCQVCDNTDWQKVVDNGFGNVNTRNRSALQVVEGRLYFVVGNITTGLEVWRTVDGTNWAQVGFAGFGDSNNGDPYYDNSVTSFNNRLFIGTINTANGGEVWEFLSNSLFLPLVVR